MTARAVGLDLFYSTSIRDPETGCLLRSNGTGYGQVRRDGKTWWAHRWIFLQDHGYLPEVVMHTCDNPPCVELTHLIPGTHADNAADKVAKGRQARGAALPQTKLSESQVEEIRAEYTLGVLTQRMLGEVYGVSQPQISSVINGRMHG